MRLFRSTVCVTLVVSAVLCAGQGFSNSSKELLQSAGAADANNTYGVTVLLEETRIKLDAQHRMTRTNRMVYRVDAADAVEGWSTIEARWSPWYQKKPVLRARVVTPDGAEHLLDPKTLADAAVKSNEPLTFDDQHEFSGPLPAVKPGAVVEQETTVEDKEPFFTAGIVHRVFFGRYSPIVKRTLSIEAPSTLPLKYLVRGLPELAPKKEESNGVLRLTFELSNLPAHDRNEGDVPAETVQVPYVVFSTATSWQAVAGEYNQTVEKQLAGAEIKSLIAKHAGADRMATIRALVEYLHGEVRYTGVEFDEANLVPRKPAETFQRKYGDCKDKATALVAMLREAGIPAHVALLSTGPGLDVETEMPGMGLFDHAIVYVPGTPELWIDATDDYRTAGTIPYADQGRNALIVDAATTNLRKIAEAKPGDNLLVEYRRFELPEYGQAKITETSEPHGSVEAYYRAEFGSGEWSKDLRAQMDGYVQREYLAEGLTKFDRGNGTDLKTPYRLKLEVAKGRRGSVDLENGVVAVRYESLFSRFPQSIREREEDTEKERETVAEKKTPRVNDVIFEPFVTEWSYEIVLPPGFTSRAPASEKTIAIGPAKLTQKIGATGDGSITTTLRLDSVKGRYTPDEAKAARKALFELIDGDPLLLVFEHKGNIELADGNVKQGLAAFRDVAAQHPQGAIYRVQLAHALLTAGLAEQARHEAQEATKLDPKLAIAQRQLGWILQHDLIGRRFKKGFDYAGAVAAYRRAKELDPKDTVARADLAILLEYDAAGERYSEKAKLDDAIVEYNELLKLDEKAGQTYKDNLLYCLMYAGHYKELNATLATLPQNVSRLGLALASIAAAEGAKAAIQRSTELARNPQDRSPGLYTAAMILRNKRMYAAAADLIEAGAEGNEKAAQVLAQARAFRTTKRYEDVINPKEPLGAVQRLFAVLLDPSTDYAQAGREYQYVIDAPERLRPLAMARQAGGLRSMFAGSDVPGAVGADLIVSNMKASVEGTDQRGYRLRVQPFGSEATIAIVARTETGYRLMGFGTDVTGVGVEALRRLKAGDAAGAKEWLDWARESVKIPGGDDPLAWPAFPRLWTRGDAAEPSKLRLAALSLIADTEYVKPYVAEVKEAVAAAPEAGRNAAQTILLATLRNAERWDELRMSAMQLLEKAPTSDFVFRALTEACRHLKDGATWEKAIAMRLAKLPDDHEAARSRASLADTLGDAARARTILKELIDSGRGTAEDMNQYGWDALVTGKVEDGDVEVVQRANTMTQNRSYAIIHTLACLYAATGKTKQARDLLTTVINLSGLDQPDTEVWFGLAMVAEQYGETEAAIATYKRMERINGDDDDYPTATWAMAQKRLRPLQATMEAKGGR